MGIGYNLGNTFDSYYFKAEINSPEDQITYGKYITNKKYD